MDIEIRKLFEVPEEDLYLSLLVLLQRLEQLECAAIYEYTGETTHLTRITEIGDEFPESIDPKDIGIIDYAIESNEMVAVLDSIAKDPEHNEPYLMAVPLKPSSSNKIESILLVKDMPFMRFTKKTQRRIRNLCAWSIDIIAMRIMDNGYQCKQIDTKRIFYSDFLHSHTEIAIESFKINNLDSTLLLLWEDGESYDLDKLESVMIQLVRVGDYAIHLPNKKPHLLIFLPLTGTRGVEFLEKRCKDLFSEKWPEDRVLQSSIFNVMNYESALELREDIDKTLESTT